MLTLGSFADSGAASTSLASAAGSLAAAHSPSQVTEKPMPDSASPAALRAIAPESDGVNPGGTSS